jgi:hypothetical protein
MLRGFVEESLRNGKRTGRKRLPVVAEQSGIGA